MFKEHPPGLRVLTGSIVGERFCYYGMRAILVLYMIHVLFVDLGDKAAIARASSIYGWFTGIVYLMPLLGGYVASRYWGERKSSYFGAVLMGVGYLLLAVPTIAMFFFALFVITVGNGFFKPNASAMVKGLYPDVPDPVTRELKPDKRLDSAYTLFYWGVNLGAFFSPFVCGGLAAWLGYGWGFAAAGVFMAFCILYLWMGREHLGDIGLKPVGKKGSATDTPLTLQDKQQLGALVALSFFIIFFFMAFEQAGSSLTVMADTYTNRSLFGYQIPASWFQSVNPVFILLLGAPFAKLWDWLAKRNANPSIPMKTVYGLVFASIASLVMIPAGYLVTGGSKLNMLWLVLCYFIFTVGELCCSPIGLSMVAKLSPAKFISLMMGVFFLAIFLGNTAAGQIAALLPSMKTENFFGMLALVTAIPAVVLLLLVPTIKRWGHDKL